MINELPASAVLDYAAVLPGDHLALISQSVAAGNTAAQLWQIAHQGAVPTLVLWEGGNNGVYVSQFPVEPAAQQDLVRLIAGTIRPRAIAEGVRRCKLRVLAPVPDNELSRLLPGFQLRPYTTLFYGFNSPQPRPVAAPAVTGISFAQINRELLANERLAHREEVRDEIAGMWPSEARFFAVGFGYAAIADEQIICWCTAEFVGPTSCGIGIATRPDYERRGVASATAANFVRHARSRTLTPYWECNSANLPSRRVAEKVGFTLLEEEHIWVGTFEAE